MKKKIFIVFTLFQISLFAQFTEFHPQLNWFTIKGEKIQVHYHQGAERTARVVAKIAEEIWDPICSLYEYEPEEVHYVIKDLDDYANGAAYFFDNKIEIWTSALDYDLRGTHNWLRNVITHEFTHMVQIQAGLKSSRKIPAIFFQVLGYEVKRRPDILYGFPNLVVSYPLAMINIPAWFAEGTAQYMRKEFDYDNWDTHRDMILRMYALDGNLLTWNQMGVFGKTSLGNESVYNSGFALTRYIAQKYGEDKLRAITEALGNYHIFTIDQAFEKVLNKSGQEIYNQWSEFLKKDYLKRTENIRLALQEGEKIAEIGFGNFYPIFSPDGKFIYYISNKNSDYFSPSSLYQYDIESKKESLIKSGIRSTFSFIPNTKKIIYSKISDDNPNWYNIHDLYVYDIESKKEKRLTLNLRANHPNVSNNGKYIAFLFQRDGTTNLGIVDIDGTNFRQLTFYSNGEQVYNPKFSPDDSKIIFDYSYHHTRDIAIIDFNGGNVEFILKTDYDERNPKFISNEEIIFSSDQTGIFNLYSMNLKTKEKKRLTNVLGAAIMGDKSSNGDFCYSGYTSTGYKIFLLKKDSINQISEQSKYHWTNNPPLDFDKPNGDIHKFNINALRNFNDYEVPDYEPKTYRGAFSKLTFFPFLRFDNYNTENKFSEKLKPGVFLTSNDMLNRYSIFAGGSINTRMERDLFLQFEYKNKLPLITNLGLRPELSFELYSISRKADVDIQFGADTVGGIVNYDQTIPTDVTYDLFEINFILKHRLFSRADQLQLKFVYSSYDAVLGSFILPQTSILYPTTKDNYFIGRNFECKYSYEFILPTKDSDINPLGMMLNFTYNYEFNKFNSEGAYIVEDGLLKPLYRDFNFHRLEFKSGFYLPVFKSHSINTTLRIGSVLGPEVPDFFNFYLGGLIGMKSYPFYSISGNEVAWLNLTYRLPLFRNIDKKFAHLYLDKIFLSFNADIGNAWNGKLPSISDFKKGIGTELRIQMKSYYLFPTSLFFHAAYSFDKFEQTINNKKESYGKEWSFYGGVLFDFAILNFFNKQMQR
jgi:Tol biopolymer transport system component